MLIDSFYAHVEKLDQAYLLFCAQISRNRSNILFFSLNICMDFFSSSLESVDHYVLIKRGVKILVDNTAINLYVL